MVSTVLVVAGAAVAYWVFNVLSSLQRNVTAAKKSGLPYYITRRLTTEKPTPAALPAVSLRKVLGANMFSSSESNQPDRADIQRPMASSVEDAPAQVLGGYY